MMVAILTWINLTICVHESLPGAPRSALGI